MKWPARCKACKYYHTNAMAATMCEYILYTGEPRGCSIDANCDKFKPKKQFKPKALRIVR